MTHSSGRRRPLLNTALGLLAAGLALSHAPTRAGAQTFWTGAIDTNWGTAGNWNPATVPGSANENVENTLASSPIVLNSGSYTINSFLGTQSSSAFGLDGGTLAASVPGTSTFNMTGEIICNGSGTLSGFVITAGGGVVNGAGETTLNGITFAGGTGYQGNPNTTTVINGTLTNNAGSNFLLDGGSGVNTILYLGSNTAINGAGTVTLSTASGGGTAYIAQAVGGLTLTNNSTIQGNGIIGVGGLALANNGTVDANVSGAALTLNGSGGITNSGTMEASGGGILTLDGVIVNNAGGLISTTTSADSVLLGGSTSVQGGTLTNTAGGFLGTVAGNTAYLDGSTGAGAVTINGTYTSDFNASTYILGTINNNNVIQVNAGNGVNGALIVDTSNLTLQGGGTVNLTSVAASGGEALVYQASGGLTLTNVNNTIQGEGIIGYNGLTLINEAGGIINANSTGSSTLGPVQTALTLESFGGPLINQGLLEATNNGVLQINGVTVNNAGGNITANGPGASVQLYGGTTIQGGNLNNNGGAFFGTTAGATAILDGSTGSGPITVNGTYTSDFNASTYVLGTINNNNLIQVNAGNGVNGALIVDSANLTLQGGGTVNLNSVANSGGEALLYQASGGLTLTNVDNTIQGEGIIGYNGLALVNTAGGVINANSTGGPLETALFLESLGGTTINQGLIEATNVGVLDINGGTINNLGGNITGNAGTTVNLYGGTTIQGGNLNNNGAAYFGTVAGATAVLDGATQGAITLNGGYTGDFNSSTYLIGTVNNNNLIQINAGNGVNTALIIDSGNLILQGGGTVNLTSVLNNGGEALLYQAAGGLTLTNVDNTIQGEGIIGYNGLTLVNTAGGIVNANSTGTSTLGPTETALTLESLSLTNQGLVEATNSGVLDINGVIINNAGGTISANGGGASVQLYGNATIQGGTLSNNGGAFFGTLAGNGATLDGSTQGAITINGTYTSDLNSTTYLIGTLNNQGNILVNGGAGFNTQVVVDSSTLMLTGGGTLTLNTEAGGGDPIIYQAGGGTTLENFNNTIQGSGIIGYNGLSLLNDAAGTVHANVAGGTLLIDGGGTVTNNGTFEADAGSALHLSNVAFTNFSGNTLTGGTYIINGQVANPGTLQIDALGTTGGEIVNNAATIILNGPNSNFVDAAGLDALSQLAANTTANSNLTITGGRVLTTPGDFSNAGTVYIGTGSAMQLAGVSPNYTQSGGTTTVNGTLGNIDPMQFHLNGGILGGTGTVIGDVIGNAGTIAPGLPSGTGTLTISGNLTDIGSALDIRLGGVGAGQFDVLDVTGTANLGAGSVLDVSLFNGFNPTNGETFTFLDFLSGGLTSQGLPDFFGSANGLTTPGGVFSITETNNDSLTLTFTANSSPPPPPSNGTPEPAPMVMLGSGLAAWMLLRRRIKLQRLAA